MPISPFLPSALSYLKRRQGTLLAIYTAVAAYAKGTDCPSDKRIAFSKNVIEYTDLISFFRFFLTSYI